MELLTLELKARKKALDELREVLNEFDYDIAEKAIDTYMDCLEIIESGIISE